MGGTPSGLLGGALGGNGLSGSHNKYEADASPTRPDLYQAGNNYKLVLSQFQGLVDASPDGVTLDSLAAYRSLRFDQQVQTNPYFFNGPFTGVLVQPAGYTFIYRFMANHSADNPVGYLSSEVLQSWFGVEGTSGNYKVVENSERIPENWVSKPNSRPSFFLSFSPLFHNTYTNVCTNSPPQYRRAIEYPYDTPYFVADALAAAALHPKFLNVGGNTGTPNSFVGVDVADLSGGLFNSASLLEGNNLACFVYQVAAQAKPDLLLGALTALTDIVGDLVGTLACPELQSIDADALKQFPGYQRNSVYG